jgi:hypothetical protein
MKRLTYLSLFIFLIISSCSTYNNRIGLQDGTGFIELPFPSNNYMPGQIIEVYTRPTKVEITHQPNLNWDQLSSSSGWNISTNKTKEIKGNLSAKIANVLKGKYEYASNQNVKVSFTNTKTYTIQKSTIYSELKLAISNNSDLKDLIEDSIEDDTHFDVITTVISANVAFNLIDSSNNTVDIDSEIIEEINSQFDINFSKNNSKNTVISGTNLIIGFHKDPKLVKKILKRVNEQ